MSYSVARRQKEIGVRLALGATPERVVRTLLADLSRILPLGLAAGGFLSVASTRLAARLYQASPQDPANLALSALILATVALAAALIPARRSARLDPVAALREE
jgi:ABC-type antimicrobial peptide transport system permease subunit